MKFTFIVLTFNHENYVLDHLESIKFQIKKYGADFSFQLIIADDGSKDKTLLLSELWLSLNKDLFYDTRILADGKNYGTCINYTKTWQYIDGDYCKITAGDDVYSFNNLFKNLAALDNNEVYSGLPLLLIDDEIKQSRWLHFNIFAADYLYRQKDFGLRIRRIGEFNAPNIFLTKKIFANQRILEFIRRFKVVEDFPLFVALSKEYRPLKFLQTEDVNVYYRRTAGSTFRVKPTEFSNDKDQVFQLLISETMDPIERFLLKNRLMCFRMKGRFLKIFLNLNYYMYAFLVLGKFFVIFRTTTGVSEKVSDHQRHFNVIRANAEAVRNQAFGFAND